MIKIDKKWKYVAMISIAAILFVQPTKPIKYAFIFLTYLVIKSISHKKFNKDVFISFMGGILISLIWWWNKAIPMFIKGASSSAVSESQGSLFTKVFNIIRSAFPPDSGTATRPYSFSDFFFAKSQNMINNPVGIGWILSIVLLISILLIIFNYKKLLDKKNDWQLISLIWLIYTFFAINTMTFNLPIGLFAFRYWMLFAFCIALIGAQGLYALDQSLKKYRIIFWIILIILLIGFHQTSFKQKYDVNTAIWGPALYSSNEEIQFYSELPNVLPKNTPIFSSKGILEISADMYSCVWCNADIEFKNNFWNSSPDSFYSWMKENKYEYLIITQAYMSKIEPASGLDLISKLKEDSRFSTIKEVSSSILFKI